MIRIAPRAASVVALLLLAPAVVACGSDAEVEARGKAPEVTVVDAGAEPRQAFALDVEEGHVERASLTLDQSISAGSQNIDSPPITLKIDTTVTDVTGEQITIEATYGEATVDPNADPAMAAQLEPVLRSISGLRTTTVLSPYGESLDSSYDIPDGVDSTVRSTLEQFADQSDALAVPFPDEPLGVGASWTATQALGLSGIEVTQTSTYTLTSLVDGVYTLDYSVEQEYTPGGGSDGFEVTGGSGSGSGTLTGTIGRLLPTASTSQVSNEVRGESGGTSQTVSTDVTTTLSSTVG